MTGQRYDPDNYAANKSKESIISVDPTASSAYQTLQKKYEALMQEKVANLEKEIQELKKKPAPIVAKKEEAPKKEDELNVDIGGAGKKVENPTNAITNNVAGLNNGGSSFTNTTSGGNSFSGNNNSGTKEKTTFGKGKVKSNGTSGNKNVISSNRGGSVTRLPGSVTTFTGGAPIMLTSNDITAANSDVVTQQLQNYIGNFDQNVGQMDAFSQSQYLKVEYGDYQGRGTIPFAVMIGDNGEDIRVPLIEEFVDKETIKKITEKHDEIAQKLAQEEVAYLENDVKLEALKKELADTYNKFLAERDALLANENANN